MKLQAILICIIWTLSFNAYALEIVKGQSIYMQFNETQKNPISNELRKPILDAKVIKTLFGDNKDRVQFYNNVNTSDGMDKFSLKATTSKGLVFTPDQDKHYTLAQVWLADNGDYEAYLNATDTLREQLGANVVFKLKVDKEKGNEPDFIILVQWSKLQNIAHYAKGEAFLKNQHLFASGTTGFNWYQVTFYYE